MKRLSLVLLITFSILKAYPQQSPHPIKRLSNPINFDGEVTDGEWDDVEPLPLVSHWPSYADEPNARTLLRIAYDDKYLYWSAICYDDLSRLQESTFERDGLGMTMDHIAIVLDTYNDNENALAFVVTSTGSRADLSIRNDAQGNEPVDLSWNSYWEARVSKTADAWVMEARLPFSSLRFQTVNNEVAMGLIAYRYMPAERQMDIYPKVKPDWGFWSFFKPSQAQDVSFSDVTNKRPWFTSPYLLGSAGYHHTKPDDASYPEKLDDTRFTAGLDVQHALTDNMNLDITVNTDFAQVEADDQVVNLSRFSFFFPEKRRFFLERSSIMDFGFDANNRLFYSRRIGIKDGKINPLWGGARLVGRVGNYDVGILNIQSREYDGNPSENFGVLRLRKRVSKNNSYVGGIFTSRSDLNGVNNYTYGLDAILNLFGNDYLKVNVAGNYISNDSLSYENLLDDRKRLYVMWENRSQIGFNYSLSYSQVDKQYDPGLGFEVRNDFKSVGDRLSYGWFVDEKKKLRFMRFDLKGTAFYSNSTNQLESLMASPGFYVEWKNSSSVSLAFNRFYDNVYEAFDLSDDIQVPIGEYTNNDITLNYQTPQVNFLNGNFNLTSGTFYGGDRLSAGVTPSLTLSKYLTLSGFYQYNQIDFKNEQLKAHVGRLKVSTSLDVHLSVNAFVQVNSLSKVSAANLRLRYNWKDGNDLYIVYNETLNNNGRNDLTLPFSDYRALIVKYIYTFQW